MTPRAEHELAQSAGALADLFADDRPLRERLQGLCQRTVDLLGCDRSSLFLLEGGVYSRLCRAGSAPKEGFDRLTLGPDDPLVVAAVRRRSFVYENRRDGFAAVNPEAAERVGLQALAVAPIFARGPRCIGILTAVFLRDLAPFRELEGVSLVGLSKLAQLMLAEERSRSKLAASESQRHLLEARLRTAERLEAVGQLAGAVAHDFNNLLTIILAHAELLTRGDLPAHEFVDSARQIQRAAESAAAQTGGLLAFSRQQLLRPRALDLNQTVSEAVELVRSLTGPAVEFVTELAPDLSHARVDPAQLHQVLVNLVLNARDAMPGGGKLTLRTENVHIPPAERDAPVPRAGSYVRLSVCDTGEGMDEATRRRIFEPFFTTKGRGRGTGLGLATVHGIVSQSGGGIEVFSRPGHGTTFQIYLPRTHAGVEHPPGAPRSEPAPPGATILLTEDEAGVRKVTARALERRGHTVLLAASAEEALDRAREHDGRIDLLITDVVLPNLAGPDLAARLRSESNAPRVLYVSGYSEDELDVPEELALGAEFLAKPFTLSDLEDKVSELLAR